MSTLTTRGLSKRFGGVHAVDHVDLSFEGGNITALVGPNGSGKTTLINTITGIVPADGGTMIVDDIAFSSMKAYEAVDYGITRTFQNSRLIQQMSVLDNLLLALTERNVWGAFFEHHGAYHLNSAEDVLKKVGLWEKRNSRAEELSYGQRKLLEVARALAMRAKIYFFDEPFAGLFPEMAKIISDILRGLRDSGAVVVLVEHDMALVRELADHCYVLDSGKVIAQGKTVDVLSEAVVIEAYLGK